MSDQADIYAIGDIHGCASELKALLHKLPLNSNSTLIFLGDYVDRGPDSKEVIETLLDLRTLYRVITLKGNHESLFLNYLLKPIGDAASNFIFNGGSATLASYSNDGTNYEVPGSHKAFLLGLKTFHSTDTHFFVHAGIPPDYDFKQEVDAKMEHYFLWIRDYFLHSKTIWPKLIVHGHSPVEEVDIRPNRINVDTGCVYGGKLTAINVRTKQIYSVDRAPEFTPKSLQSRFNEKSRPFRFKGEIDVTIEFGSSYLPFKTIDYSEFGVQVFKEGEQNIGLSLGAKVKGTIHPERDKHIIFTATIVRLDQSKEPFTYGLKFDSLENITY